MNARTFTGPAGKLDARIHGTPTRGTVLVLHPHPAFGGSMGTRFVYRLCKDLESAGWQAVRFDFRGVGRSEGSYDEGRGETEDALAVWDALAAECAARGAANPAVVGFSFGGAVGIRVAAKREVPALVLVAPPAHPRASAMEPLADAEHVRCPAHVVIGTEDEQVPPVDAEQVRAALPRARITVLEGADHFLTPTHHDRGIDAVVRALDRLT